MIVVCTACSEEHNTSEVKFLNIEEDLDKFLKENKTYKQGRTL
jgi:hypothetical protein